MHSHVIWYSIPSSARINDTNAETQDNNNIEFEIDKTLEIGWISITKNRVDRVLVNGVVVFCPIGTKSDNSLTLKK